MIKFLFCKHKDPSSTLKAYVKMSSMGGVHLESPALERQRQVDSEGLTGQPACTVQQILGSVRVLKKRWIA